MKQKTVLITFAIIINALGLKAQITGTFTDSRDGKIYKTITIGTQTWMAENLNYNTDNSWCYGNSSSNCNGFGRLYTWETAKTVCPSGWHLPSKSEFETLLSYVGGSGVNAFHALKEAGSSGFTALYGGWRNNKGQFGDLGVHGHFWTSSEARSRTAWGMSMNSIMQFSSMRFLYRDWGFSVRCIKD
jgi:uncharacterized protein (TIGR02145 family)